MTISERIFKLLQERGMSQKEFSDRTGIAQSSISDCTLVPVTVTAVCLEYEQNMNMTALIRITTVVNYRAKL